MRDGCTSEQSRLVCSGYSRRTKTVLCGLALDAFACKFSPTAHAEITRQATDLSGSYISDVWLTQR